ncbi:MAG: RNA polymerase sigma factor [Solimonas sp.]
MPPAVAAADAREAFTRLLAQHAGIVRKVAAGYAQGHADRHDLMQEITLQLWRAWPRYAPERPFSTWMYRIALNTAISHLRRATHPQQQTVPLDELGFEPAAAAADEDDERLALVGRLIAALDPLNRALLLLYLDDRSYREIAQILGLSETNVATKLGRLKERLRRHLAELTGDAS